MCEECYSDEKRITPLFHPLDCLEKHTQYICGTCGRCICAQQDEKRGIQRWNFPFKSLETARLYLRVADFTMKKACGIYELQRKNGQVFYKIFSSTEELELYLRRNKDKTVHSRVPVFSIGEYKEYPHTEVRKLTTEEINQYMRER